MLLNTFEAIFSMFTFDRQKNPQKQLSRPGRQHQLKPRTIDID